MKETKVFKQVVDYKLKQVDMLEWFDKGYRNTQINLKQFMFTYT